jgi:hypothetical protein
MPSLSVSKNATCFSSAVVQTGAPAAAAAAAAWHPFRTDQKRNG